MIDGRDTMGNPITGSFVVFDLVPVMVFKVELDRKIRAFKKDEVSDIVSYFQPSSVLEVSPGDVSIPSSSNQHSGLEVFARCHDWKVRPNVTTRQVVLLDLSSFSGSAKREVTVLVRSDLRDKALSTYSSQRRLVRSFRWKFDRRATQTIRFKRQSRGRT